MAFVKYKTLYVLDNDGVTYIPFNTVNGEIFLTDDLIQGIFSYDDYVRAINSRISKRVIRLYLLNEDETIKQDLSEYIISGGIDFNYQQGQTRSCNLTLMNYDNSWFPNPTKGRLWKGIKFRIDIGLYYRNNIFWKKCGIFTPNDPNLSNNESNRTISFQMYDKFALLDGTLGGKQDIDFKIPVGTKIRQAIQMCLSADKGNGKPYDLKPIIFPARYEDNVTPYTITKTTGTTMGEIIIQLANMISCDVYYNEDGQLVLTSGVEDVFYQNKPILWNYSATQLLYKDTNMTIDFSKIVNKITVKGAIENGYQYKGIAINTNPNSQSNIYMTEPNPEYIEDKMITSDELCLNRAFYELNKKVKLSLPTKYKSIFIPHLIHNGLVLWSNKDYKINSEKFVIQNLHIEINTEAMMDISMTNLNEVSLIG